MRVNISAVTFITEKMNELHFSSCIINNSGACKNFLYKTSEIQGYRVLNLRVLSDSKITTFNKPYRTLTAWFLPTHKNTYVSYRINKIFLTRLRLWCTSLGITQRKIKSYLNNFTRYFCQKTTSTKSSFSIPRNSLPLNTVPGPRIHSKSMHGFPKIDGYQHGYPWFLDISLQLSIQAWISKHGYPC